MLHRGVARVPAQGSLLRKPQGPSWDPSLVTSSMLITAQRPPSRCRASIHLGLGSPTREPGRRHAAVRLVHTPASMNPGRIPESSPPVLPADHASQIRAAGRGDRRLRRRAPRVSVITALGGKGTGTAPGPLKAVPDVEPWEGTASRPKPPCRPGHCSWGLPSIPLVVAGFLLKGSRDHVDSLPMGTVDVWLLQPGSQRPPPKLPLPEQLAQALCASASSPAKRGDEGPPSGCCEGSTVCGQRLVPA